MTDTTTPIPTYTIDGLDGIHPLADIARMFPTAGPLILALDRLAPGKSHGSVTRTDPNARRQMLPVIDAECEDITHHCMLSVDLCTSDLLVEYQGTDFSVPLARDSHAYAGLYFDDGVAWPYMAEMPAALQDAIDGHSHEFVNALHEALERAVNEERGVSQRTVRVRLAVAS